MLDDAIVALADALEVAGMEYGPRTIDAMRTEFAPERSSTHPCCPLTKTTVSGCPQPTPRPGTIVGCPR
jgi:hypothetical protein